MDEMIYNGVSSYYNALEKTGYMSFKNMEKLLILIFYRDFVFNDYRGILSKEDYFLIEKALDCLYGTTCLIPYPDYLKMGKLHLGQATELAHRVEVLEKTKVLKLTDDDRILQSNDSDIMLIVTNEEPDPCGQPRPKENPKPCH